MTEISQSHGTLNSATEESSTPSNNSEYFSVTSSLDILNCNDEVYYSMDEEMEKDDVEEKFSEYRRYECHKIRNLVQTNDAGFAELRFLNSQESVTEIFINEHLINCEDWDKVCDNLNSVKSQESVSTDEEDDIQNNYSMLTESVINNSSVERRDSDIEENASVSLNNTTQMTNSIIEGELSEMNDIVYESSLSQDPNNNEDESVSLKEEEETEEIPELELTILEMVRKVEFSEFELSESEDSSVKKIECEHKKEESPIILEDIQLLKNSPEKTIILENNLSNEIKKEIEENIDDIKSIKSFKDEINETSPKSKQINFMEDSPVKSSSLCCSIKRKKVKENQLKSKPSKSKSLFSFLRFFKKEKVELKSPKSLPQLNFCNETQEIYGKVDECEEYQSIPFIDADFGIYSDSYIPLAKQEVYCE